LFKDITNLSAVRAFSERDWHGGAGRRSARVSATHSVHIW
jgi:hypothetical protein